jgi:hypothetical protein
MLSDFMDGGSVPGREVGIEKGRAGGGLVA